MKFRKPLGFACMAAVFAACGEVIYENDFSTRTSAGAIPTSNWYEMSYHVGTLARNYDKKWDSDGTPYSDPDKIQDGWALANIHSGNDVYVMAAAYVATNSLEQVPEGDSTNQFFKIHGVTYPRTAMATHPIGNDFTNGTVRFSVDMRAPAVWPDADALTARIVPLYKSQMNALNWGGSYQTPAAIGMQWRKASSSTVPFLLHGAGDETNAYGDDMAGHMGRYWHRFVLDVNLDTKRVSCSVYKLGLENPTFATPVGERVGARSDVQFYRPLTAARGAISGIGLYTYRTFAEASAVTNSACFDNVSVSWKAPGATDFLLCYENDFTTRRYRTLCPVGTTSTTYPPATGTTTDYYWGYSAGQHLVPSSDKNLKNKQPQPLGVDHWRRINDDGLATVQVVEPAAYGRVLRITSTRNFAAVTQPLGEEIASGKVRIAADVRLPDQWHWETARSALVDMGTTSFASALYNAFSENRVGAVGIGSKTTNTEFHPRYGTSTDGTSTTIYASDVNCTSQGWYRIVQTADVGAQKYDYALYEIVNGVTNATPVFSQTGVTFQKSVSAIGSFALLGYAAGTNTFEGILFDNVKVWKNVGEASEKQIYDNDFSRRWRTVEVGRRNLAPKIDRPDSGVDHWTRRNSGLAGAYVQQAANPALAIVGASDHAYVFHPFGTTVGHGKTLKFQVDVRPPERWSWNVAKSLYVMLGDDVCLQGNRDSSDQFIRHECARVCYDGPSGNADACGLWTGATPYAYSGSAKQAGTAATAGHWYRLRFKAVVDAPTYSAQIYDMGTSHPELSTADGTRVDTFENLAWKNGAPVNGISGFGLAAFGTPGFTPWDSENPDAALFDNIRAEIVPSGVALIVR